MIFVTVGTQKFPFNRLLETIDDLVGSEKLPEEVFAQTGQSTYLPKHYEYSNFLPKDVFAEKIGQCSLVITHGGVGAITAALKWGKPVIVIPRLCKYAEHVDDHQLEIANTFARMRLVLVCGEDDRLDAAIEESRHFRFEKYVSQRSRLLDVVQEYLKGVENFD